ncbi:MAG: carbohydrate porin [Chthoniobacterales bacterium]|nr:carbohydrate porin [Chthoniobacterales bacterium]
MALKLPTLAATGALVLCATVSAQVQQAPEKPWMQWDYATGDWDKNRPLLSDRGVEIFATYTSQVWGNVTGGLKRGATYSGLFQFGLDADLEKAIGWKGGSFNTTWVWIAGGSPTTDLTGALFPASGTEAPTGFRALDLWLQQKFFDDVATLRAGLFNIDRDFTVSRNAALMLNAAFGWPLLYNGSLGGPPAYPFAAPGLYGSVEPGGGWKFQAAIMQGDVWPPAQNPTNFYWKIDRMNGLLCAGEAQYAYDKAPLPGTVKLGVMFNTGYPDSVDGTGEAWGGSFFYGIIDQLIWREPGCSADCPQGLSWFNRTGFSGTLDRSPVGMLFNTGFVYEGLFAGRDDDAAGIGLVWTQLSAGQAAQLDGSGRGTEMVLEATYQVQISPCLTLQPDVQFIVQPGGSTAVPDALVIGMSASVSF